MASVQWPSHIWVVVWHSGSALVSINEVNLRRAQIVLGWVTVSQFNSQCRTFISVCNQLPRPTQPSILPGSVSEYQLRKEKAGMVHYVSRQVHGAQVKLWDPLRMRVIPKRLRCVFTTTRYTNPRLPLPLALPIKFPDPSYHEQCLWTPQHHWYKYISHLHVHVCIISMTAIPLHSMLCPSDYTQWYPFPL